MPKKNIKQEKQKFHYIYKITFLCGEPEGRYYLGKRSFCGDSIEKDKYAGSGNFCFSYYKKHGKILGKTYIKEIVEINLDKEINRCREGEIVGDLWKTDPLCMNQCPGGDTFKTESHKQAVSKRLSKKVLQYSLSCEYLKTFESLHIAAREIGVEPANISSACIGKQKTAYNYIWRYEDSPLTEEEKKFLIKGNAIPIIQYDKSGNKLNTFRSIKEASIKLGINSNSITRVAKGDHKLAGGFIFKYVGEPITEKDLNIKVIRKYKPVIQFDLNENYIAEYSSIAEAAKAVGVLARTLSGALNGKKKTVKGYIWKFKNK